MGKLKKKQLYDNILLPVHLKVLKDKRKKGKQEKIQASTPYKSVQREVKWLPTLQYYPQLLQQYPGIPPG